MFGLHLAAPPSETKVVTTEKPDTAPAALAGCYGSLEERVPSGHPLRPTRSMVDEALKTMSSRFDDLSGRRVQVDSAGAAAARLAVADALLGSQ
jgi:hypothetical protein